MQTVLSCVHLTFNGSTIIYMINNFLIRNFPFFSFLTRTIMEEVTQELREREQRWQNIEVLAGCSIITNAGLHALELMLRPQVNGRPHSTYAPSIGMTRNNSPCPP